MSLIRVFVADDHVFAIPGLCEIIAEAPDMKVVGQTMAILDIIDQAQATQPDVIVLDMAWPGDKKAGLKLIPEIRKELPKTRIVAITAYPEQLLDLAQAAGAYPLSKGFSKKELLDTIRWAFKAPNQQTSSTEDIRHTPLTERERDILAKVTQGQTDKQIGFALGIAEGTVKKHVSSILSKLNAASRTEAAIFAERHGLLRESNTSKQGSDMTESSQQLE